MTETTISTIVTVGTAIVAVAVAKWQDWTQMRRAREQRAQKRLILLSGIRFELVAAHDFCRGGLPVSFTIDTVIFQSDVLDFPDDTKLALLLLCARGSIDHWNRWIERNGCVDAKDPNQAERIEDQMAIFKQIIGMLPEDLPSINFAPPHRCPVPEPSELGLPPSRR